jgi:dTMP kinase
LLFALDRREASNIIKKWLLAYDLVIVDRYVYSNIAFQCAKLISSEEKEVLKRWILDLEYGYNKIPRPILSIFLDVPFQFVKTNLLANRTGQSRGYLDGKSDIHETDIEFQAYVQEEYLKLIDQNEDFSLVDCGDTNHNNILPEDKIHFRIVDFLVTKGILPKNKVL